MPHVYNQPGSGLHEDFKVTLNDGNCLEEMSSFQTSCCQQTELLTKCPDQYDEISDQGYLTQGVIEMKLQSLPLSMQVSLNDGDCSEEMNSSQTSSCQQRELLTICPEQYDEISDKSDQGYLTQGVIEMKLQSLPLPLSSKLARRKRRNKKKKTVEQKDPTANHSDLPKLCEQLMKKSQLSSDVVLLVGKRADGTTSLIKKVNGCCMDKDAIRAVREALPSKAIVKCKSRKLGRGERKIMDQQQVAKTDSKVQQETNADLPKAQKPGPMSIDECVDQLFLLIKNKDYITLHKACCKLEQLQCSSEMKHKINYWRILQCLGEVAIDTMVRCLISIQKDSYKSPVYHNLSLILHVFMASLCNVGVIKRVNVFQAKLGPILLKALRQTVNVPLVFFAFQAIHRCLIVGKTDIVELFVKGGLLQDLYAHIKLMDDGECFDQGGLNGVSYSARMLLTVSICGSDKIRHWVKHSKALQLLKVFIDKLSTVDELEPQTKKLEGMYNKLTELVNDENVAEMSFMIWNCKDILQAELEQEQAFAFCSTPFCLKLCEPTEKFRYCGACRLARYCSESCQKVHWRNGHKETCLGDPELLKESLSH